MANFILDQKGRLLNTVFSSVRGDGAIGGNELIEVTIDLSQVGSGTSLTSLGTQSSFPNSGLGLAAADTIDVAVLPYNFQIQSVQLIADTNAPTPDVIPSGVTGAGAAGTLTALTYSLGRFHVAATDRSTSQNPTGFTGAATTYANAQNLVAASAMNASSLIYTTATDFLPYITPASSGSLETSAGFYVLRWTVGTITGTATNLRAGRFRYRINGAAFNM